MKLVKIFARLLIIPIVVSGFIIFRYGYDKMDWSNPEHRWVILGCLGSAIGNYLWNRKAIQSL